MNQRRQFLSAAVIGAAAAPTLALAQHAPKSARGPVLLTVSGLIGAGNRGALDPKFDQLLAKQKVGFDKAHAFDFAAIAALPAVTIKPTLEYDSKAHSLKGPLLADVLKAAGVALKDGMTVFVRANTGPSSPPTSTASRCHWAVWARCGRYMTPTALPMSWPSRCPSALRGAPGRRITLRSRLADALDVCPGQGDFLSKIGL
jgi:hypothetical protein